MNVENRLRCSTRTKMDLGRGLSNQGGRKVLWLHQENWTLTNNIMSLSTFDTSNAFQCLAEVCNRRLSVHPDGHEQTNWSFETCTDRQKMPMTISRLDMDEH